MMEESESSRRQQGISFPPMKTGKTNVNKERKYLSPVNSSSSAESGCSKNSQNEDLITSISALINTS